MYQIKFSKAFLKDFHKLDSIVQTRVLGEIESMKFDPFSNVKKLKNVDFGIFRKRIGDYRIRFDVGEKIIVMYRVRHRKYVYKDG